jgi:hypothetical protein
MRCFASMAPAAPPKKKTSPWLIVLACFGIVALLVIAAIAGFALWLNANKGRLAEMAKESEQAAQAYGAEHDQEECLGEGLRKIDVCDGIMCRANAKVFTERCIIHARPTSGFCDGVPATGEIMKTVAYCQNQCTKRGRKPDDQNCSQIMQAVAPACARISARTPP